ncbi:protein ABHD14A-like isoform X2 [Mercenaria mercenaria]|nr:protein ABHD14A-like isoform X2 [Mercenaria mercenaria]XP_053381467.1 protein ABHD14A-like isoform X2 [Mercenaria mercenaria]XP_053381468.1 protein ABHD14A-like isoform X2 [Mercenaria mercenaria]XP_053381469.1 protein ABHD14A-like isoform X2 [Mercenaria mercenaria]XP_053381470.1 protein ABHD14A-like isoform X2 [Mercenaria mercenaria]XP_053381471.1 protein ABHD14A-like isoform X2 [Mercenaria mercenaria]XP_053381472.1 protein ABHD14A-like isoform X2 [Mercenaria mercenaria]XP_053381473.1 pro
MSKRTAPTANVDLGQRSPSKDTEKAQASKDSTDDLKSITVTHVTDLKVKVGDKEVTIAYRETKCDDAKLNVLFLHGQSFKSETWASGPMWTLQLLYKTGGFRAVAIDLPGYGDSPPAVVDGATLIQEVIHTLKLDKPVIVSPSMSGGFFLPYMFKDPENIRGFVPVAPVGTNKYKPEEYKKLKIPTLVIYGERDKHRGAMSRNVLENLPEHTTVEVPGAGHACYMNNPDFFHKHFIEFLKSLMK